MAKDDMRLRDIPRWWRSLPADQKEALWWLFWMMAAVAVGGMLIGAVTCFVIGRLT